MLLLLTPSKNADSGESMLEIRSMRGLGTVEELSSESIVFLLEVVVAVGVVHVVVVVVSLSCKVVRS
jgi:hypothetical protein